MILVGNRISIHGDWDTEPTPNNRIRIIMPVPPIRGYGAGWNKTTKLCIEELERVVTSGMTVLDLGTGTGILALVAYMLGASVYATENDEQMAKFAINLFKINKTNIKLDTDHSSLPNVDLCVANIGDALWDIQETVKSTKLFIVGNISGEIEYASRT